MNPQIEKQIFLAFGSFGLAVFFLFLELGGACAMALSVGVYQLLMAPWGTMMVQKRTDSSESHSHYHRHYNVKVKRAQEATEVSRTLPDGSIERIRRLITIE